MPQETNRWHAQAAAQVVKIMTLENVPVDFLSFLEQFTLRLQPGV